MYRQQFKKMKKITLISSAILTLLVVSCQKENVAPTQNGVDTNNFTNHVFKYKKEIKVYDRTNQHFVTVELKSDNESMVNNEAKNYNGMELVLLYDNPLLRNNENCNKTINKGSKIDSESKTPLIDKDVLLTHFDIANKGNSTGFKLIPKENNLRYDTVYFTVKQSRIYSATCSWFYLYNQAGPSLEAYDYYLDGTWHLIQYKNNITQGTAWYFTGPYAPRILDLRNHSLFSTWVVLSIYY